jgi:hypothetical protein
MPRHVWHGVSMDSLEYHYSPPCFTTLHPVDGHPWNGLMTVSEVAAHRAGSLQPSYYSLGYPMPYEPLPSHLLILPMAPSWPHIFSLWAIKASHQWIKMAKNCRKYVFSMFASIISNSTHKRVKKRFPKQIYQLQGEKSCNISSLSL